MKYLQFGKINLIDVIYKKGFKQTMSSEFNPEKFIGMKNEDI